ncbi:MAG: hypothetical protein GY915_00865 [bacterium]|nr:hypothetical protein [bacterium]
MLSSDNSELEGFIEELDVLLSYAEKVYRAYLDNEKTFIFAKVLYDVNSEVRKLVRSKLRILTRKSQEDAMELLFHLDVWSGIWIDEVNRQTPRWNELFTFPNKITFPFEHVRDLLALRR